MQNARIALKKLFNVFKIEKSRYYCHSDVAEVTNNN